MGDPLHRSRPLEALSEVPALHHPDSPLLLLHPGTRPLYHLVHPSNSSSGTSDNTSLANIPSRKKRRERFIGQDLLLPQQQTLDPICSTEGEAFSVPCTQRNKLDFKTKK